MADQVASFELPQGRSRSFALEVVQTLVLVGVLSFAVRGAFQNFRVDGPSMQPTLASGELLWVNKAAYFRWNGEYVLGGPQRGDIAVLHSPDPTDDVDLVKRIIGLPGDRLRIDRGEVFINNQALPEPYLEFAASYSYPPNGQTLTVPTGDYFVLGDNRPNSRDSHFGWFVPAENLIGRTWLTYWPPSLFAVR